MNAVMDFLWGGVVFMSSMVAGIIGLILLIWLAFAVFIVPAMLAFEYHWGFSLLYVLIFAACKKLEG